MRVRHILLTSATSVSLFLIASNAPDAYAQKGKFLSPASPWAVTKVEGNPEAGQAGYCAVAKRYEGNAILTIARNQGTETSLALDLQKPVFNTATPMRVVLDPGAGEQRDYSISPASSQAFVVRLGSDEAFFNAIDRTGILRVEVSDQTYVFNISDISAGQSQLSSCLASSVQPAAGGDKPVSFAMQVESKSNKEFIDKLNARIQSLESQNNSLQAKIVDVEQETLVPLAAPARTTAAPVADTAEALRLEELRAENLRLKSSLQAGELSMRSDKLSLLEADNARLSEQVSRKSDVSGKVAQLQSRIDALVAENSQLQRDQKNSARAELSALEDNIERLETENKSLKIALAEQAENNVSDQLRARIEQIEEENRDLKQKVLVDKQSSYSANSDAVREIRAQHAQEVSSLRAQIESLRVAQIMTDANDEKIDVLNGQLASLRADNLLLQQELHEKSLLASNAVNDSSTDIAALEFENKKLQSLIDKSAKTHLLQDKAMVALEAENAQLKSRLENVDVASVDVDSLYSKLETLTEKLQSSNERFLKQAEKLAALESQNSELKIALDARVEENLSLANALDDVNELQKEIVVKDAKLAEFEGVPERLQSLLADYQAAKAEKVKLESENVAMLEQRADRDALSAKLAEAEARNDAFVEKLGGLQQNVLAMSKLNEEVKALSLALADKEKRLQELDTMREEFTRVVAENASLKEETMQLASAQAANAAQADQGLMDENVELRRALSSVIAKVEGQNEIIRERDDSISNVLAQNEVLQDQLDFAAQLMASNDTGSAEVPLKKEVAFKREEPEAKVILASAAAVPAKPAPRVSVVHKKDVQDDVSFAETLAQLEPAAGDENVQDDDVLVMPDVPDDAQDFMERDLNQAQIYEEQLKRSLSNQEMVDEGSAATVDVEDKVEADVQEDVVVEDISVKEPDNDIDAVIEKASATDETDELPALNDAEVETADSVEMNAVEDAKQFVAQKNNVDADVESDDVSVKMSQDPFEGIAVEGEDDAIGTEMVREDLMDTDAPLPKAVKQPSSMPVEIENRVSEDVDVAPSYASDNSGNAIDRVLRMSNIGGVSGVQMVANKPGAYQWRVGDLYGSGEQRSINSVAQFDGYVKEYLLKTEARCPGDFAIVPDNTKESGSIRVDSYEVACVGANVSSSASLVFYNEAGMFTVLAHETQADKMGEAMAVRDKIFASLSSGRDS